MRYTKSLSKMILGAALGLVYTISTPVFGAESGYQGGRVAVQSDKSFDDVTNAVKNLVSKNVMMVMAEVDHDMMLSTAGLQLKAQLFIVGNPSGGKQLYEQNHAVGLNAASELATASQRGSRLRDCPHDCPRTPIERHRCAPQLRILVIPTRNIPISGSIRCFKIHYCKRTGHVNGEFESTGCG